MSRSPHRFDPQTATPLSCRGGVLRDKKPCRLCPCLKYLVPWRGSPRTCELSANPPLTAAPSLPSKHVWCLLCTTLVAAKLRLSQSDTAGARHAAQARACFYSQHLTISHIGDKPWNKPDQVSTATPSLFFFPYFFLLVVRPVSHKHPIARQSTGIFKYPAGNASTPLGAFKLKLRLRRCCPKFPPGGGNKSQGLHQSRPLRLLPTAARLPSEPIP